MSGIVGLLVIVRAVTPFAKIAITMTGQLKQAHSSISTTSYCCVYILCAKKWTELMPIVESAYSEPVTADP